VFSLLGLLVAARLDWCLRLDRVEAAVAVSSPCPRSCTALLDPLPSQLSSTSPVDATPRFDTVDLV
jgi:hypothetical protein